MKATIVIVSLVIIIILISGIYAVTKAKTETRKYQVITTRGNFEIRFYPEAILATVKINGTYDNSKNSGFGVLAGYIFGGNAENTKIAMTAPVSMSVGDNTNTMSFVMPAEWKLETLPTPQNNNILLHKSEKRYTASVRFSGYANDAQIRKHKEELIEILGKLNLSHNGEFEFLGYNSPFQPVNRRNEIQVELTEFNPDLFDESDNDPVL